MDPVKVLFVCMGNICRSPTAEGVFRKLVVDSGLGERIQIDSCGTGDWHVGKAPDSRAIAASWSRSIDIKGLKARQVIAEDLSTFDYVLAMDYNNLAHLRAIQNQTGGVEPELFLAYARNVIEEEVPDPYYGGDDGFEHVLNLIEAASEGLLAAIRGKHFD
ncbi:MAG: low molecular weight protein-tyrosine-phosphatase [Marinobacter sp.]|uniref:low molecular weight protein-tyrosine-phosphatase n=1 Tax=Marinobacter sp. TaxID=50741 RepID=UPI0034A06D17